MHRGIPLNTATKDRDTDAPARMQKHWQQGSAQLSHWTPRLLEAAPAKLAGLPSHLNLSPEQRNRCPGSTQNRFRQAGRHAAQKPQRTRTQSRLQAKTHEEQRAHAETHSDEPLIADFMLGGSSARTAVTAAQKMTNARNMTTSSRSHRWQTGDCKRTPAENYGAYWRAEAHKRHAGLKLDKTRSEGRPQRESNSRTMSATLRSQKLPNASRGSVEAKPSSAGLT